MSSWRRAARITLAVVLATAIATPSAIAGPRTPTSNVTWSGNGTSVVEGTRTLNSEQCDENGTPYLLFVLASTKTINTATISFAGGEAIAMTKTNGEKRGTSNFKYTYQPDGEINLDALLSAGVSATWSGSGTPTLTVSHGCLGATPNVCDQVVDPLSGYDSADGTLVANVIDEVVYTVQPALQRTELGTTNDVLVSDIFNGIGGVEAFVGPATLYGCMTITMKESGTAFFTWDTKGPSQIPVSHVTANASTVSSYGSVPDLQLSSDSFANAEADLPNLSMVITWTNSSGTTTHTFTYTAPLE